MDHITQGQALGLLPYEPMITDGQNHLIGDYGSDVTITLLPFSARMVFPLYQDGFMTTGLIAELNNHSKAIALQLLVDFGYEIDPVDRAIYPDDCTFDVPDFDGNSFEYRPLVTDLIQHK